VPSANSGPRPLKNPVETDELARSSPNMTDAASPKVDDLHVICIAKRWDHHTPSGGYDQLAHAVGAEVIMRRTNRSIRRRVAARLWRAFSHSKPYLVDYWYEDWLAERRVLRNSRNSPPDVVHVLYGDEQLDLLLRQRKELPCPLIVTFHLPTSGVRERFEKTQKHLLSGINLAVVVARNQLEDFGNWLGADRVIYVPHGINTDQFCPGERPSSRECVRLITVGDHLRDWKAIDRIIDRCQALKLAVRFDIVARKHRLSNSASYTNVHFHAGISESELIRLYREADALLVPVTDATANNAALEALGCGTPVISTIVGGIPDYVDNTCGWLFEKGEVDRIVDLIGEICNQPEVASSRREAARTKALGFSWQRVAKKMRTVYESVAHHQGLEAVGATWE
jgi:glycosyltransferase involved in cell wall biosynthesis